ncbi:ATP-binding protein [Calothrix sp. NIES-2098]|uniref:ATP-binding protein n=1 Tax=Calothrix sp. NIES-2098 TaxID=1954171 RepID=UPI000B61671B|nr:putative sensor protein [Calothrix sp. NIES-2098]
MTVEKESAFMDWLIGGGEMGKLIRSKDWSNTPLGAIASWPQSLRTTVSLCLASNFPISITWGSQHIQIYNDGYWPICGAKHPHAMGQDFRECWASAWPAIEEAFNRACAGETSYLENQRMFLDRHGYLEETFFTFSFSPIRDETGGVGGLFHPVTELTQQTLAERRLKVLRNLSHNTTDAKTVAEAIALVAQTLTQQALDLPFVLIYVVDADCKQAQLIESVGLAKGTVASPILIDLESSSTWPLTEVLQSQQSLLVDDLAGRFGSFSCGPYSEPPQTAIILPINLPGMEHLFGLLVAGISARRALDRPYQLFYDMLGDAVTNALAKAHAYEVERKRAEALAEIDRAKTVFFSNVSHEFRTPLTLMLAPLEDALADIEAALPPTQRDRLELVRRNGLRLLKLVNTLLDFSRIEAGRIQAVYEPTDLATFTADLASTFRSLIERAGMCLVVDCPPLPVEIYIDREMWEKIVLNLLSNAFKFTFTGTISVRLQNLSDRVELAIADTGTGIPPEEIPHLFERFHRVKGVDGRSFEGSGIGLSLVQELVKLHGGTVKVTSKLSEGSCFIVSIPTGFTHLPPDKIGGSRTLASTAIGTSPYVEEALRWLPEAETENSSLSAHTLPHFPHSLPSPAYILIVDDNADMRNYIQRLLGQRYEVEAVEDGIAALNAIYKRLPDLVLTDVMMPRLDGFELLRQLRANPRTQELAIILLSARAGEESRIEGLETGADDYLVKPFSTRELLARVEANLKMAQMRKDTAVREYALRLSAEKAQREAEATFEQLTHVLDSMSDAFVRLDKDWRIVDLNAAAEKINKKPRTAVIGKTQWEEWPASVGTNIEFQYRRAITKHIPVHFEHHYYVPPNYDVWVEIHAYPLTEGLGVFFRDITERKQAEAKLKQSHEELEIRVAERTAELSQINADLQQSESILRSFFNSGAMLMGIVELHGDDILHISDNQATAQFFGTTPEAMQNRFATELGIPQPTIQKWLSYYRQAQQIQAPVQFEYPHDTPTEQRWLSATVCPIAFSHKGYPRFSYIVEDITARKQSEARIEASLREKEVLLKEIHHRVKNNLGIVSSLLQMQSRRTQDIQANAILRDSQNRIASIALVHEKLYGSQDLSNIDFAQYLRDLTAHLFASTNINSRQIKLNVQVENVALDIETAVPCGLIVNELISNALKYAFPDDSPAQTLREGEIHIGLSQASLVIEGQPQNILTLIVRDNGIGLPENFDIKKAKTLGITLVQGLVRQIQGKLEINCQQGTEFKITFLANQPVPKIELW